MIICKMCNKTSKDIHGLSKHLLYHKYSIIRYYVEFEKFEIPKCECGKELKLLNGLKFRKTCGDKKCVYKNKKHTENSRNKISEALIKSHKNGEHPGWSFINKDKNKRSYPEKWFVKNVLEKYDLYSKYTIKEKMPFNKYFLDFAFLDMKIDLEIDGQQHFRSKESIEHDKERDNFLLFNNWKVYRISWIELKNNPNKLVNDFLNFLNSDEKYHKYDVNEVLKLLKKKKLIYGSIQKYREKRREKLVIKYIPLINIIEKSNINFSKFGWVKEVSILTGIKYQKVNHWMKRYMKDFYEKNCFKRSRSSTDKN